MKKLLLVCLFVLVSAPVLAQPVVTYRALWDPPIDATGVTGYVFYVDSVEVGRTTAAVLQFDGTVTPGLHTWAVAAMNEWGVGPQVQITRSAGAPGPPRNIRVGPPPPLAMLKPSVREVRPGR